MSKYSIYNNQDQKKDCKSLFSLQINYKITIVHFFFIETHCGEVAARNDVPIYALYHIKKSEKIYFTINKSFTVLTVSVSSESYCMSLAIIIHIQTAAW